MNVFLSTVVFPYWFFFLIALGMCVYARKNTHVFVHMLYICTDRIRAPRSVLRLEAEGGKRTSPLLGHRGVSSGETCPWVCIYLGGHGLWTWAWLYHPAVLWRCWKETKCAQSVLQEGPGPARPGWAVWLAALGPCPAPGSSLDPWWILAASSLHPLPLSPASKQAQSGRWPCYLAV